MTKSNRLDISRRGNPWSYLPGLLVIICWLVIWGSSVAQAAVPGNAAGTAKTVSGGEISFSPRGEKEPVPPSVSNPVDCDYYLYNASVVDGSGAPAYTASVAVKDGIIVDIGEFKPAPGAITINMTGLSLTPGFIDIHTHTENYWAAENIDGRAALLQGVTAHITGNCGTSPSNISEYLRSVEGAPINVGVYMGYKALRRLFISDAAAVTAETTKKMAERLDLAIKNGALGLSVGLDYYPQNKATTEELITLAKITADNNALFAAHIRGEYNTVLTAVNELMTIVRSSGVRAQYAHIKVGGSQNWSKQDRVLEMLNEAVAEGLDIRGDVYLYNFSSLDIGTNNNPISTENYLKVLKNPYVMLGSDGGLNISGGASHPRVYGNNARLLARYVRDEQVLTLEEAVKKMTSMPAERFNFGDRGLIKIGYKADLAAFNLKDIADKATRNNPNLSSAGMKYVFVNGVLSVSEGKLTGEHGGMALKHTP